MNSKIEAKVVTFDYVLWSFKKELEKWKLSTLYRFTIFASWLYVMCLTSCVDGSLSTLVVSRPIYHFTEHFVSAITKAVHFILLITTLRWIRTKRWRDSLKLWLRWKRVLLAVDIDSCGYFATCWLCMHQDAVVSASLAYPSYGRVMLLHDQRTTTAVVNYICLHH